MRLSRRSELTPWLAFAKSFPSGGQSSSGVEQRTHKPLVGGSNPSSGTTWSLHTAPSKGFRRSVVRSLARADGADRPHGRNRRSPAEARPLTPTLSPDGGEGARMPCLLYFCSLRRIESMLLRDANCSPLSPTDWKNPGGARSSQLQSRGCQGGRECSTPEPSTTSLNVGIGESPFSLATATGPASWRPLPRPASEPVGGSTAMCEAILSSAHGLARNGDAAHVDFRRDDFKTKIGPVSL